MDVAELQEEIKKEAYKIGFNIIGFSQLSLPSCKIASYEKWLKDGYLADMTYLREHLELKKNPKLLLEDALSIISLGILYRPQQTLPQDKLHGIISAYAQGRDYHKVLKKKLKLLSDFITKITCDLKFRTFVDSGPVFEKLYAENAGLGTKGKNSLVINPQLGSQMFLGEILTNLNLIPNNPLDFDPCHSCTKCKKSCPTNAILENKEINASLCIAYLTVEYKGIIERKISKLMGNHIFGCDECQTICPWNNRKVYTKEIDFTLRYDENFTRLENLINLTSFEFEEIFAGSPIRRACYESFIRNVIIAIGNSKDKNLSPLLLRFKDSSSEVLKQHALWALEDLESL